MNLLMFLIIGAAAGWLAGNIMKGSSSGLWMNMLVGVVGAFLGGFLFGLLGIAAGNELIGSLITATVGAILLLFILEKMGK